MTRMLDGMTVQSDHQGHFVFCVRCFWRSSAMKYAMAFKLARTPDIHSCSRKRRKADVSP